MSKHPTISRRTALLGGAAAAATGAALGAQPAEAKTAVEIDAGVQSSLTELFAAQSGARQLYERSAGVLIIPEIIKASFFVGGAYGEGALLIKDRTDSYWAYGAASFGFQFGAQSTRQALFFTTDRALDGFRDRDEFEVGIDAEVTLIDDGAEFGVDSTEARRPIIGIVFSRKGLLGGASLQGGRYNRILR